MAEKEAQEQEDHLYNWLVVGALAVLFLCILIFWAAIDAWFGQKSLEASGQQGDYFGGHFGPIFGAASLVVVVVASYKQYRQQRAFFREQEKAQTQTLFYQSFTQGISLISEWDRKTPGCPQAMRLVDYYSKVALERNDDELFRLLNTVITEMIRETLRGKGQEKWHGEQIVFNYPFAVIALSRISEIRERDVRAFKETHMAELKDKRSEIREKRAANGFFKNPSTPTEQAQSG
jgi:uncharacterized membrane protein